MRIEGWQKGVDNVHNPYELGEGTLSRAINVDISDAGKIKRRRGSALSIAMANAHSAWDDGKDNAYFVFNNVLNKLLAGAATQTIGNVAANSNHLSYVAIGDTIYFTCASARGRIRNDVLEHWGVEVPVAPPTLSVTAGSLDAGTYSACVTYLLADGRESGASLFSTVVLTVAGGIATTAMPIPTDSAVTRKRLYLTTANGEMLYMATSVNAADQYAVISSPPAGAELRTRYLSAMPFGIGLTYANGRAFVIDADDPRIVKFSLALQYDYTDVREKYYFFPEDCTLIAGTNSGLYVATSSATYYISGAGTAESKRTTVFEFGAIAETAKLIPRTEEYIWMSERGAVIGHDGGEAEILSNNQLVTGSMVDAASMVREKDGLRQYVVVGNITETNQLQAESYTDAEIERRASM